MKDPDDVGAELGPSTGIAAAQMQASRRTAD